MKLVALSLYEAYPPRFGAGTVTYNLFKYLEGKKYLIQIGSKNLVENLEGGKVISIELESSSRIEKFSKIFKVLRDIKRKIEEINPDVVIFEGASWSLYYLVLFKILKKRKIIYHDHNLEYELRRQKENFLIRKITFFSEKYLLKKSYLSFMVSERDTELASKIYSIPKPKILRNGVDLEKFNKIKKIDIKRIKKKYSLGGKSILFLGIPSYLPNKEAIEILVKKIMPQVIKKHPSAKLILTGGEVFQKEKFIKSLGNIPFENLPSLISSCSVGVAPIISGSGTRLKILEYMASGIPVVSTSKGCEGIKTKNGKNIIINNDFDKFAKSIIDLLSNEEFSERIGKQGKKLVSSEYSYKRIAKAFQKEIN